MKHLILLLSSFLLTLITLLDLAAQNEIELRPDGIVVPRTTTGAVTSPVEGMLIYDTSINDYQYYNGFGWSIIGSGPFERSGTLVRQQTGTHTDDFVFGRDSLPSVVHNEDKFFFFDQSLGAFRGGGISHRSYWAEDSLGTYSFAYGYTTKASGDNGSAAMGWYSAASGTAATAMGWSTSASGDRGATALGELSTASGNYGATALGSFTTASGSEGATALGKSTTANGNDGATALGKSTTASGNQGATALGYQTTASGNQSATALGKSTTASGNYGATALGNSTLASGDQGATALGYQTTASGDRGATAMGYQTIATGDNCTVVGRYNDTIVPAGQFVMPTSPLFIIGNGFSGSGNRSNAMVVRQDGHVGIGTSTPSAKLNIKLNSLPASPQLLLSEEGNDGARINFENDSTTNFWTLFGYPKSDDPDQAVFNIYYEINEGAGSSNNKFQVFANGNAITEGKMGVGRPPANNQLEVQGNASKSSAGSWLANSDRRIKTDIRSIDNGIELIKKLHPVRFKYTEEWKARHPSIKDQYYYNYIAQEFKEVFPDAVQGSGEYLENDNTEILQIDTYSAQIANIAATQELIKENEVLKELVSKLKKKDELFRNDLEQLKNIVANLQPSVKSAVVVHGGKKQ